MNKVLITIRLTEKTRKALNVKTAQEGTTVQRVVETALQSYLALPRGKFDSKQ